jgi:hypothetical protein
MSKKITENATLQCDKGSTTSKFKVNSQDFCFIENKLVATEKDIIPNTNIPKFGNCTITKSSCFPNTIKWDETASIDKINEFKLLTDKSTCQCAVGGKINIIDIGHSEEHFVD